MTSTRTPTELGAAAHTPIGVRRLLLCGIVAGPVFAIVAEHRSSLGTAST
jgi:hypothetical protein